MDVPNRALNRGSIHARKRIGALGKELLHSYSFSGVIINKDTGESGQESGKPPEAPAVDDVSLHTTSRIIPDFLADTPLNKDLHSSRDVQRRVQRYYVRVRQTSEVHRICQAVLHLPALVDVLGIDADPDKSG